jgi:hypothetical protein
MKDTAREVQENVGAGTSLTRSNNSQTLLTQAHAQRREGAIRLQGSSSLSTRLPGTREACKVSEEGELGFPDTGDGERERDKSRSQPKRQRELA